MILTAEQANALSLIYPYPLLHELSLKVDAGAYVTDYEKREALMAKVDPHLAMLKGEYSKEELKKLCVKWRIFFQLNYPDMFHYHIQHIESIQRQLDAE